MKGTDVEHSLEKHVGHLLLFFYYHEEVASNISSVMIIAVIVFVSLLRDRMLLVGLDNKQLRKSYPILSRVTSYYAL